MILAIDQPNYIPWKGYFDIIHDVDLFIFYNDVQYTSRDWRNRNRIVTPNGVQWLTVPVGQKTHRLIYEVEITDGEWQRKHYETIRYAYGKAPFFRDYMDTIEDIYLGHEWKYLYELDQYAVIKISRECLGITTEFADSRDYETHGAKHDRLLSLVDNVGGYQSMSPVPQQRTILFARIMRIEASGSRGKTTMGIRNTHNCRRNSHIRYPYLICCLMSARMHHTTFGGGERVRQQSRGNSTRRHSGFIHTFDAAASLGWAS